MSRITMTPDPDFSSGGHALLIVEPAGAVPATGLDLKIQRNSTKKWLTPAGWDNADRSIVIPAANVATKGGQLMVRLGPDVVDWFDLSISLLIELPQLGVVGKIRTPDTLRPSVAGAGKPREVGGQQAGPGPELDRKIDRDTSGERPDGAAPVAEEVKQPPAAPPIEPAPPKPVAPPPEAKTVTPKPEPIKPPPRDPDNERKFPLAATLFGLLFIVLLTSAGVALYYDVFGWRNGGTIAETRPKTQPPLPPRVTDNTALPVAIDDWERAKRSYGVP